MAITNHDRVGKALEFLKTGLAPFVQRELKNAYGHNWQAETKRLLSDTRLRGSAGDLDAAGLLVVMDREWKDIFSATLGKAERSIVNELLEVRNRWAHQKPFSTDDAYRSLDSIARLLTAVSALEADEVEKMKMELLRLRFDEQVRAEKRKQAGIAIEGQAAGGLKPWREVVMPHPDVASGRYQQAEFAADLWQVHLREGSDEYRNPVEFFRRTFLTNGLRDLLTGALERLSGKGRDPVIELQTNFGGGKTHSMLALYHLFSGTAPAELSGLEPVLQTSGIAKIPNVRRVVIVGNKISPGAPQIKPDGVIIRTLWGELAWQLGGKEGFAMVKQADETSTNPGDALRELFNKYAPCLILIDEWVAYARQLHDQGDLPGGSFETHFTFAQTLSEAVKAAKQTLLVVSIPASESAVVSPHGGEVADVEVGGQRGRAALERLKNAMGRVESSWRPASAEEGFEIVRRRLFEPITNNSLFVARDAVAKAFFDLYRTQNQEFPPECRDGDYEKRLKAAYPIHPEVFDRLYNDWSSLVRFQRTRGVLRLMAAVIHSLWERQDRNPLILPAFIPIDNSRVQFELTRYLPDNWPPVIERDVDGPNSLPLRLDGEKPNLGRYSACRRVARTIYLGSAPMQKAATHGIEDRRIKLGCVQPGESVATFGDALRHLSQNATYLYADGSRYWYSTQPTVTKMADDRAEQLKADSHRVAEEIERRARESIRARGDFHSVHPFPTTTGDVPDEHETRLVVLSTQHPYSKEEDCAAIKSAKAFLESRGSSPRLYKNALVFLAPDRARLAELNEAVRYYLAWKSIEDEWETLNLDPFQQKQTKTQRENADKAVDARIPETFSWLLVPTQGDPRAAVEWQALRLSGGDALAIRASKKLKNDGLIALQYAPALLRSDLDRIPLWRGDHVSAKQLADDYAQYLYLQRVRDPEVLITSIRQGLESITWRSETFAYAARFEAASERYYDLVAGKICTVLMDGHSLLVKPDVAAKQIEIERADMQRKPEETGGVAGGVKPETPELGDTSLQAPEKKIRRFHGSVKLDASRLGRDAGRIAEEIVQHLVLQSGADVEVTLEIHAELSEGAPDNIVRTVTENCRTLKFADHGFERE